MDSKLPISFSSQCRSVSGDGRNQQVSNLATDYPEISPDFHLPPSGGDDESMIPGNREFSSVLRISSGGVRIWTHYDVMDNVYCQVVGHKTATLWPPWQASNLYLEGWYLCYILKPSRVANLHKYSTF